jgi:hypothetical protein
VHLATRPYLSRRKSDGSASFDDFPDSQSRVSWGACALAIAPRKRPRCQARRRRAAPSIVSPCRVAKSTASTPPAASDSVHIQDVWVFAGPAGRLGRRSKRPRSGMARELRPTMSPKLISSSARSAECVVLRCSDEQRTWPPRGERVAATPRIWRHMPTGARVQDPIEDRGAEPVLSSYDCGISSTSGHGARRSPRTFWVPRSGRPCGHQPR